MRRPRAFRATLVLALTLGGAWACGGQGGEGTVVFTVPTGSSFQAVSDTLQARGLVGVPAAFRLYARLRGDDRRIKAGRYEVSGDLSWGALLDVLADGRVATRPITLPEGFRLTQMAPRIARISGVAEDSVLSLLRAPGADSAYGVPGPGLEGYLFPETYRFAPGVPPASVVATLVDRYHAFWTPERRSRAESLGMTERELVTLASIVQAEARVVEEMPTIASVYHNRLEQGWLLQADPTVQYALGGAPRERLLYAAIDSVEDHPYNTYTQGGLPPGPIGAPGAAALEAALYPADEPYMFFVARPDGSHVFTRTLAEHNRAKAEQRRAWDSLGSDGNGGR